MREQDALRALWTPAGETMQAPYLRCACLAEGIEYTNADEVLHFRHVRVYADEKVLHRIERSPVFLALPTLQRRGRQVFDCRQRHADARASGVVLGKVTTARGVRVGRGETDTAAAAYESVSEGGIEALPVAQYRGQELRREVALQVRAGVCLDAIGSRVSFTKAVARKPEQHFPNGKWRFAGLFTELQN